MARGTHTCIAALSAAVAILLVSTPLVQADDASETCDAITYGYDAKSCGMGSCPDDSSSIIVSYSCPNGRVAAYYSDGSCLEACVENYYGSYSTKKKLSGGAAAGIVIGVLICCCGPLIIGACLVVAATRKRRAAAAGTDVQSTYPATYDAATYAPADGKPVYANAVDGAAGVPTPYVSPSDPAYGQQQYAQPQAYAYDAQQAPQQGAYAAASPPGGAYYTPTQGAPADDAALAATYNTAHNPAYAEGPPLPYNATPAAPQYGDGAPVGGPSPVART